jgi:hypothetical protein
MRGASGFGGFGPLRRPTAWARRNPGRTATPWGLAGGRWSLSSGGGSALAALLDRKLVTPGVFDMGQNTMVRLLGCNLPCSISLLLCRPRSHDAKGAFARAAHGLGCARGLQGAVFVALARLLTRLTRAKTGLSAQLWGNARNPRFFAGELVAARAGDFWAAAGWLARALAGG